MRLTTRTSGSGPITVGLVHGLGASGATWQPLIDRMLADGRWTVTTVDLRGHGSSDRAASYGLDALADDLVETLPAGLHSIVGHSLGGPVLVRAVERLAPSRAIYLDPGFRLALPTTGIAGRLFWLVPLLSLGVAQALRARRSGAATPLDPDTRALVAHAQEQFDRRMAIGVFRDVAFHPLAAAPPAVPSTLVLSDESPSVLPDALVGSLEHLGWGVRRLPGLHHDLHLEDPDRTCEALRDLL
ncbi:alpha/beta fold hydrolase [Rathayibacter sp. VKM Ac-2630]|uniref:alpha/beta fold hydrolase n=1 Tax=Rathayibacter sp. VKM Ac-2630 TaxID=1938617 RepID=UPI000981AF4B|nr:alpha/beta hydrolase [Rathayibacter sp. VKM Ac-2630]OOB91405.1 alpha/beta hydrolase [Rathayibacter sp. VKM Ac-2630]